ncbi:CocE/NonD family hydrolase [Sphingomonas naphthae]|uniref:CocE/NonD family hydrolase n=2 Tax=Sphingomonas naphthae TaxID=1813468 RepID=A0ABY7TQK4_9SPHN|nr:CocE/NonD family hydrolase [Sphingomonas naphthae]WCT75433.1 CocE/NonD family hydrolase [Sphingomonas naphthae]
MLLVGAAPPPAEPVFPAKGDIPEKFVRPEESADYIKRVVEIPMRDGVKLHTVIVIPKGATRAPIMLTRTPYNADMRAARTDGPSMLATLPQGDEVFVKDGYIRVFQDVRGKYGSEGVYVMTRPVRGPLNPTTTDHVTDAYDTIDWLVKNTPESNGKVGMIGSSYEGFTVAMALLDPHPALKVAAPESPMVDGWMGDDWFMYGAFRNPNLSYFTGQTTKRGKGVSSWSAPDGADDYDVMLKGGSTGDVAKSLGLDQLPLWRRTSQHPAYDDYWQGQALDKLLAKNPSNVPTIWLQGIWDQEDMWGAIHSWSELKAAGKLANNHLVMGPWRHSGVNYDGTTLGPLKFEGDTALQFRRDVLKPFFDQYLKDAAPAAETPQVFIYNTGENHWDRFKDWPLACDSGCASPMTPMYLAPGAGLSFSKPAAGTDKYVSDPAKPVPYLPRPVRFSEGERWRTWLLTDQRFADGRPDVLTYVTEPLKEPLRISGAPVAELHAATTGTDADWVVKVIDVYPQMPSNPSMDGYEFPVSLAIFRGRYRDSFSKPTAIPAGKPQTYKFALPTANHVFQPGHRVMIQIQSTLFPLYDRNPQTFVPNIFFAKPGDYKAQTHSVLRGGSEASAVWLPVVK